MSSLTDLLQAKTHKPHAQPGTITRTHLMGRLTAGMNRKLTLISAPAGYGKTVLVSDWVNQADIPVAWLSIDSKDNDPSLFIQYLIASLQTVDPTIGQDILTAVQSQQTNLATNQYIHALLNQLAALDSDACLILDDFHYVDNKLIHDALTLLIDHMPPHVHMLIASRVTPPLPCTRYRIQNQLVEIGPAELRFNLEEASLFLHRNMKLELTEEQVATLTERTEGWIAGLQMAAISLRGRSDIDAFVESFSGDHYLVADFLLEEVLARQPAEIEQFLCETALLPLLSAPLCDYVTGRNDSRFILKKLERANLFLVPLDDRRKWYRYHQLFAELLRNRLMQTQRDRLPLLHERAGHWFAEHDMLEAAIDHTLAAQDYERAATLVEEAAGPVWRQGRLAQILEWFDHIPDDVLCQRPRLNLFYSWVLWMAGHADAAWERADQVDACLMKNPAAQSQADQGTIPILGVLAAQRAAMLCMQGKVKQTLAEAQRAMELLPDETIIWRGVAWNAKGVADRTHGDWQSAERSFLNAKAIHDEIGHIYGYLVAVSALSELYYVRGRLRDVVAICEEGLRLIAEHKAGLISIAGIIHINLGKALYQRGDLTGARRYLESGLDLVREDRDADYLMDGFYHLAMIYQIQGNPESARQHLQIAERLVHQSEPSLVADMRLRACQTRFALLNHEVERASGLFPSIFHLNEERYQRALEHFHTNRTAAYVVVRNAATYSFDIERLVWCRLLLAHEQADEAATLLNHSLQRARQEERLRDVIEILLLKALARWQQERHAEAITLVLHAVSLAEPEEMTSVFLEEGKPVRDMLAVTLAAVENKSETVEAAGEVVPAILSFLRYLLYRFNQLDAVEHAPADTGMGVDLTPREEAVLKLLAEPLTYSEIAAKLGVTENTIRTHVKNIYSKFGAHNRLEVLTRAERNGLL